MMLQWKKVSENTTLIGIPLFKDSYGKHMLGVYHQSLGLQELCGGTLLASLAGPMAEGCVTAALSPDLVSAFSPLPYQEWSLTCEKKNKDLATVLQFQP